MSFAVPALAGNLTPPAGVIGPTMKSLTQVEPRKPIGSLPFTIDDAGSYYLTKNLVGVAGQHGIVISASDVTLDLSGFCLEGVAGSGVGIVYGDPNLRNTVIRNGTIRGWGDGGIELGATSIKSGEISGIRAIGNLDHGIRAGEAFLVTGCLAEGNAAIGILALNGSLVSASTARGNISTGIYLSANSITNGCIATENNIGFFLGEGASAENCTARNNSGDGFYSVEGATLTGCRSTENAVDGIDSHIRCVVTDCHVRANGATGIDAGDESLVNGCTVTGNQGNGIIVTAGCVVVGNTSSGNGVTGTGAGILVSGTANRIERNHTCNNDYGIRTISGDSLIVANTARANPSGNFSFLVATESGAIILNPGANFVSSNPWANFSY